MMSIARPIVLGVTVLAALSSLPAAAAQRGDVEPTVACDAGSALAALGPTACPLVTWGSPTSPDGAGAAPLAGPLADPGPCVPADPLDRCEAWVSPFYNGPGNGPDSIGDQNLHGPIMGVSPDGKTVYTAGRSDADPGAGIDRDIAVLAVNADTGENVWTATYPGDSGHRDAMPLGLAVTESGIFVTAMLSNGTEDWFSRILAFDPAGGLVWDRPLGWFSYAIVATPDGRRVVTTGAELVETQGRIRVDALTASLDAATGETVWTQRQLGEPELGILGFRLALSGDGSRVVVLSTKYRLEPPEQGYTVYTGVTTYRASGETGAEGGLISDTEYPMFGVIPAGIVVNETGSRAYVAGGLGGGPENGQQTLALGVNTSAGRVLWARRYPGPRPGYSLAFPWYYAPIALSPDEQFVFVGSFISTAMNNAGNGFAVEGLDARFGDRIWVQEHLGNTALCFGCGPTLTAVRDQVVVTARAPEVIWAYQFMTVAFDDDHGYRVWTRVFREGRSGHSGGVVGSPDAKRVYVAASAGTYTATASDRSVDMLIAAYDI